MLKLDEVLRDSSDESLNKLLLIILTVLQFLMPTSVKPNTHLSIAPGKCNLEKYFRSFLKAAFNYYMGCTSFLKRKEKKYICLPKRLIDRVLPAYTANGHEQRP